MLGLAPLDDFGGGWPGCVAGADNRAAWEHTAASMSAVILLSR